MNINYGDPTVYTKINYVQKHIFSTFLVNLFARFGYDVEQVVWFNISLHIFHCSITWMKMDDRGFSLKTESSISSVKLWG